MPLQPKDEPAAGTPARNRKNGKPEAAPAMENNNYAIQTTDVLTTPAEVAIYEQLAGAGTALAVANGVDLDYFQPVPQSVEPSCVFVGALDYRPNVDGLGWFCAEVWPHLWHDRHKMRRRTSEKTTGKLRFGNTCPSAMEKLI